MSEWIISSSVLIVLVIALRHVLRGKINLRLQYALWLVVLVRLLMPVSIADSSFSIASFLQKNQTLQISDIFLWYGEETNPGGAGEYLPDRGENGEQGNQQVGGETPGNVTTPINPDAGVTVKPPVVDETVKYPTIGGVSIAPSTDKLENSGKEHISLGEILVVIWCAGMSVTAVMLLASNLHFSRKLQKTRWLYEKKTDSLPVYESDAVETPCLFGLVRPAVYVTKEAVKDPNVMHHVLAHETTHYAHRDHIWAVLRCLCLVLHWYNPLVWWAADLSRRDAELACDEGTIERIGEAVRAEYGRTLIGLTCQGRGYLLSTATTMTGSVKGVKERIMLIANRPKMARYTVMLLIVLVMVMIGCTYCGDKTSEETLQNGGVYIVEGSNLLSPITEEQRLEVEKAFGLPRLLWTGGPGSHRYYGNYNGAIVVFTAGMLDMLGEVEVAGVLFTHGNNCDLRVYKDGMVYSLREAYYRGFLTREDLLTMQEYHWLYERTERATWLSDFEMKEDVEAAWAKEKWSKLKWYGLGGDIRYYGTYEGAVVLFEPTGGEKETTLLIGNREITSSGSFEIHVYKDGKFYSLEKAYEKGFVTDKDLSYIATNHESMYEEYEAYQESLEQQEPPNIHAEKTVSAGDEIVQQFDTGTTVLADINGDGVEEKITVSLEEHHYVDGRYEFCMQIDDEYYDQFDLITVEGLWNPDLEHFYLVDLDTSDGWLEIGFCSRGIDGHEPGISLIRYQYGEIVSVEKINGDILAENESSSWIKINGDGTVDSRSTYDSLQTAYVTKRWELTNKSELRASLKEIVPEYYEIVPEVQNVEWILTQDVSFCKEMYDYYKDMYDVKNRITLPKGTKIERARYYTVSGWVEIICEEGNSVWIRHLSGNKLYPMDVSPSGMQDYIDGLVLPD